MKITLLPFLLTLLPMAVFVVLLAVLKGRFTLLPLFKILCCALFVFAGLAASFYAFTISIAGMREAGIRCMNGAAVFPLLGLFGYVFAIPLLLYFSKWGRSFDKKKSFRL